MMTGNFSQRLDPARHAWLREAGLQAVFAAFAGTEGVVRVVGGAVRNALLGVAVADVDLAVNLPPEQAEAILQQAGIKVVRTGFVHGTITAVVAKRGYEITSLRRDVMTDGRRATVAYTDVWQEDAARRDFTMNALYADADGQLYDYFDGLKDLQAGRVRFIGEAQARIAEDYLRILRFFRFQACFGREAIDAEGLAACAALAGGLASLSRERVTQEFHKLLLADDPVPCLRLMQAHGVLAQIVPLALNLERLARLLALGQESGFVVRLAALFPVDRQLAAVLRVALRLSVADGQRVVALVTGQALTLTGLPEALYRLGVSYCHDKWLLQAVEDAGLPLAEGVARIKGWHFPKFPLQGNDLLALGVSPSPELGALLKQVEDWWIAHGFVPDRAACLAEVQRLMRL